MQAIDSIRIRPRWLFSIRLDQHPSAITNACHLPEISNRGNRQGPKPKPIKPFFSVHRCDPADHLVFSSLGRPSRALATLCRDWTLFFTMRHWTERCIAASEPCRALGLATESAASIPRIRQPTTLNERAPLSLIPLHCTLNVSPERSSP